jgi:hypothetical protein
MEKEWGTTAVPWNEDSKVKVKVKRKKVTGREEYDSYVKKLEKVFPDEELRELGRNFGTKRKNVDYDNICRVVPADWIHAPQLLEMNKENYIYPELIIKEKYHELLRKVTRAK